MTAPPIEFVKIQYYSELYNKSLRYTHPPRGAVSYMQYRVVGPLQLDYLKDDKFRDYIGRQMREEFLEHMRKEQGISFDKLITSVIEFVAVERPPLVPPDYLRFIPYPQEEKLDLDKVSPFSEPMPEYHLFIWRAVVWPHENRERGER